MQGNNDRTDTLLPMNHPALPLFPGFAHHQIEVAKGLHISAMVGGHGPGLLLLHGHPQTLVVWRKVAPQLVAAGCRVVASDLRGYGRSDKPASTPDHAPYSKRAMAEDQVALMRNLGHDRGTLEAMMIHVAHYAGWPVGASGLRTLGEVWDEMDAAVEDG